jgi:arsenical pump membrane protein
LLACEAIVVTVLNLDTAVVFMTPVLLQAARHRGASEEPFLYGAVFMANAASLLLPGSNLTNLIVLSRDPVSGAAFAGRLAPAWAVSVVLTAAFVALVFRRRLSSGGRTARDEVRVRLGPGGAGIAVGTILVLVLARPALPVLALGIAVAVASRLRLREMATAANAPLLVGLLGLAVLLGTVARADGPLADPLQAAGRWESAWLAAGASLVVNNLPAAVMLSSRLPAHPRALLLGLDLGPNLAVTGSLSAILWLRVARENDARPSVLRYSLLGLALVPLTLSAALLVPAA